MGLGGRTGREESLASGVGLQASLCFEEFG